MMSFERRLLLAALPILIAACSLASPTVTPVPPIARISPTPSDPTAPPTETEADVAAAVTEAVAATPSAEPTATAAPVAVGTPDPGALSLDQYALQEVAKDLDRPVFVTHAGDGSGRLFVVEQPGRIRVIRDGQLLAEPYLDLTDRVTDSENEQGLLGLAFSPTFTQDGRLYVYYTAQDEGKDTVARFTADPQADTADRDSGTVLLAVDDPYGNHNGGMLAFGPDGYLYAGFGDGGSAGDPEDRAQDLDSLLGKILRLDVSGDAYTIPSDNPFANGGGRPEIWIYGVRNPWRYSFDRLTGDLYIGDVGQNQYEEIDYLPNGESRGRNLGWRVFEGLHEYDTTRHAGADPVPPILEYTHSEGCSVTGGYVYRGSALPALNGVYFYADFCSTTIWAAWTDGSAWTSQTFGTAHFPVGSFGEDQAGELYLVDLDGVLYKLVGR